MLRHVRPHPSRPTRLNSSARAVALVVGGVRRRRCPRYRVRPVPTLTSQIRLGAGSLCVAAMSRTCRAMAKSDGNSQVTVVKPESPARWTTPSKSDISPSIPHDGSPERGGTSPSAERGHNGRRRGGSSAGQSSGLIIRQVVGSSPTRPTGFGSRRRTASARAANAARTCARRPGE